MQHLDAAALNWIPSRSERILRLPDPSRLLVFADRNLYDMYFSRDPSQPARTVLSFSYPTEMYYQLLGGDPLGPRKLISFACKCLPLKWLITFWREVKLLSLELKTANPCKFVSILTLISPFDSYVFSVGQHSSLYVGKIFQQFYFSLWSCRLNHKSSPRDREYDQECLKDVCKWNDGNFEWDSLALPDSSLTSFKQAENPLTLIVFFG